MVGVISVHRRHGEHRAIMNPPPGREECHRSSDLLRSTEPPHRRTRDVPAKSTFVIAAARPGFDQV
jgi:hypothetical protein